MKSVIPLELVDIDGEGYHFTVEVIINGKNARMVLDTGASRSVFDSNCLTEFVDEPDLKEEDRLSTGVGSNTLKSFSIGFEKLLIGEIEIEDYAIAVLDLQHITSSYSNIGKGIVHGVIGGDILHQYKAIINYEEENMIISK